MPTKVLTIGMGGSITVEDPTRPYQHGAINQETLDKYLPSDLLKSKIKSTTLFRINSSDIHPFHWMTVVKYISYSMDQFDAIILTHGTDTMAYTAAALSLMIQKPGMPIVFTGSILPPSEAGSDGPINLVDAMRVAVHGEPAEVSLVFNHRIYRGSRIQKKNASQFDAYGSPEGPLGTVDQEIRVFHAPRFAAKKRSLSYDLDPEVLHLKVTPTFEPQLIDWAMDRGYHGLVLEGYGIGGLPASNEAFLERLDRAKENAFPICLTTDCYLNPGWQPLFKKEFPHPLQKLDLIPCVDMTPECTLVKLMWALGQTTHPKKISRIMTTNFVGEKTPM